MYLAVFVLEIIGLYLLSRRLNQSLFSFFYIITRSEYLSILLTTLILFPGTVVHELSHLFVAEILGVRTGKLNLIPQKIGEDHVQAGSVEVQRTDPFRRTIIGLAPIFIGIICVTLLSIQLTNIAPEISCKLWIVSCKTDTIVTQHTTNNFKLTTILFLLYGYLLYTISNNMFSSKEDLQGVTPVLILVILIIATIYFAGFRITLAGTILQFLSSLLISLTKNLGVVLGINIVLLVLLTIILSLIHPRRR